MGYETDRFVENHIEEEFICSICHDVLADPVFISTCEHMFCGDCIRQWMRNSHMCPVDRGQIQSSHLHPPLRSFRDLLGKLKIQCDFVKLGCSEVLKLENLKDHCGNCSFNPNVKRDCPSGCGAALTRKEKETHNCIEYLKAKCSAMAAKDSTIAAMQAEINQLRRKVCTEATKKAMTQSARAQRNNPTFFQNHMDPQMTKEVLEIAADSIARIDHWWHCANDIRIKLDKKYGGYWGCCIAAVLDSCVRNVAITVASKKYYNDFRFGNLSLFIWKNA